MSAHVVCGVARWASVIVSVEAMWSPSLPVPIVAIVEAKPALKVLCALVASKLVSGVVPQHLRALAKAARKFLAKRRRVHSVGLAEAVQRSNAWRTTSISQPFQQRSVW